MKNILLVGGEFSNKGAELMIYSAQKQIEKHLPNCNIYLSPTLASLEKLRKNNFHPLNFPLYHVGHKSPRVFKLILKYPFLMKKYIELRGLGKFEGDVSLKDIDIVFDISGYAFTSKWGLSPVINLKAQIEYIQERKGVYIFLPQAFGPFSEEQVPYMNSCIDKASLVIARDRVSYENLKEINNLPEKINQFPDITLSFKVENELGIKEKYCCIVPNIRMLDRGGELWAEKYIELLKNSISYLIEHDTCKIKIVNHSKSDDRELVVKIGDMFSEEARVETVFEESPLLLKQLLGGSCFNIASRFHAVASSLSSGVPCIMTSWSHKYQELAEDFGVKEFCLQKPDMSQLYSNLDDLMDSEKNNALRDRIENKNLTNLKSNNEMWDKIKEIVFR